MTTTSVLVSISQFRRTISAELSSSVDPLCVVLNVLQEFREYAMKCKHLLVVLIWITLVWACLAVSPYSCSDIWSVQRSISAENRCLSYEKNTDKSHATCSLVMTLFVGVAEAVLSSSCSVKGHRLINGDSLSLRATLV